MGAKILVAEDDPKQRELIRLYLEREGHSVRAVADGRAALDRLRSEQPDLLVLDVMMPEVDGLDVCRIVRSESDVPILMISARSAEEDLLLGLDLGADDYMVKPYSPREMTARVRAMLRRSGVAVAERRGPLEVGDLRVDPARFEVRRGEQVVPVTAKEFAILEVLAGEPGRVFTRAEIIHRAFGYDSEVLERTVDAHLTKLRRKLDDGVGESRRPELIETVYGRGYRLREPSG